MQMEWPCLEFTKTVGWEARDRPDDALGTYADLVEWGRADGLVPDGTAAALRVRAASDEPAAARALARAKETRSLVFRIFSAIGQGDAPAPEDIEALNQLLPPANAQLRLAPDEGPGYRWAWADDPAVAGVGGAEAQPLPGRDAEEVGSPGDAAAGPALDRILWGVARSAAELLTAPELERVRLCGAEDCGWLFIDASRNRTRRWCDMRGCGNRAKVRRHRERSRKES